MKENASRLRIRLRNAGLSSDAINAAWPAWWSDAAEASTSAQADLRFSLARKLGLDPHSLLQDDGQPRFIWRDQVQFKHLAGEGELEKSAIASFGTALGSLLVAATGGQANPGPLTALDLRKSILMHQHYVRLIDLLSTCWAIGIPVVHLRVFPLIRKRMSAMTVQSRERNAVLLGRDSVYPAPTAFYVAHELGHIFSGHLFEGTAIVDLAELERIERPIRAQMPDPDETAADAFALELLTGRASPTILPESTRYTAASLAQAALSASEQLGIEPGMIALCFGHSTGKWPTANAAMSHIYTSRKPVWREVNRIALRELDLQRIPDDAATYVGAVLDKKGLA